MGINKVKTFGTITALAVLCLCMASCGMSGPKPDYLIMGARDNGFVAAYRGYYAITGNKVEKISKSTYENYIYKDDHYKMIGDDIISWDVTADSEDPSEWVFEKLSYTDTVYDMDTLISQLDEMDLSYTGDLYVQVTFFDDCVIIEVDSLDDSTITSESFAVFRNGEKLDFPDNYDLSSIRDVYKYEGVQQ